MPEKTPLTRHVGMEALNSVGSTGSCDSMESISSNHSAFSGDAYDHLSAEERECLMFLEETIDSLDNEDDSGVSNDELETTEKSTSHLATESTPHPTSDGNDKTVSMTTAFPKVEDWAPVAKIPQGYHSFPRIIQTSREEISKPTTDSKLPDSNSDQTKSWHGKPKSMSSFNRPQTEEPHVSDLLIIPPPEPFRDPQVVIDKRRSVTDPTDAREIRYDKALLRPATISEYKEIPAIVKPPRMSASQFPRVSSPKTISSQEPITQADEKSVEVKHGPPTAPKPRTLPPHIIIKSSSGVVSNLDPQIRPRTFSAHERITDRAHEPTFPKVPHSKEQERARFEALHKLGLDVKASSQENILVKPSKTDLPLPQAVGDQGYKNVNRKIEVNPHDRVDVMGDTPAPPSIIIHKTADGLLRNESDGKHRLSIKSNSLETDEPVSEKKDPNTVEVSPQHHIKSSVFGRNRTSLAGNMQEKPDDVVARPPKPSNEVHTATDGSSKNIEADTMQNKSSSHLPQSKVEMKFDKSGYAANELYTGSDVLLKSPKRESDRKPSTLKTNPVVFPEINPVSFKLSDHLSIGEKPQEKLGSSENISHIGTSPGKNISFLRPKEVAVTQLNPEVLRVKGNDKVVDKSHRHSTHFEPPNEPYLRFPQGSVPGLRQINIKANTLERSGMGLSGSMSSLEKEPQKASNSFFKKPLFSGNFLRSNRPRPASLGTGKDFVSLEPSTTDGDTAEKRSFFSRGVRSSAPITSVKITPKANSEEHRKEALKKLGILKE